VGALHLFGPDQARVDEDEAPVAAKGFITRRFVQETRQQRDMAEQDGRRARNDLLRIDAEELDRRGRRDADVWRQQQAVVIQPLH